MASTGESQDGSATNYVGFALSGLVLKLPFLIISLSIFYAVPKLYDYL